MLDFWKHFDTLTAFEEFIFIRGLMGDQKPSSSFRGLSEWEEVMSVLLLFPADDALLRRLSKAAERLSLVCDSVAIDVGGATSEAAAAAAASAVEKFCRTRHHLVLLDRREPAAAATADALLRALKSTLSSSSSSSAAASGSHLATTFAAVTKAGATRVSYLSDLLQLGYDMKLKEDQCASVDSCAEELLSVQRNTFRHQQRLGSLAAMVTALGNCADAVEITDAKLAIQYVNTAHERMFGFALGELSGRSTLEALMHRTDRSDEEVRSLTMCLKRGKAWDGILTGRRKSGVEVDHYGAVYPVRDRQGLVRHFVWLRRCLNGHQQQQDQQQQDQQQQQQLQQLASRQSASALTTPSRQAAASRRGSAAARVGSTAAIDAPINKVISLICTVQDGSTPAVSAALDKVLEILHQSADLYAGELLAASSQDGRIATDYVGGLMSSGSRPLDKKRPSVGAQRRPRPSEVMRDHINQLLENSAGNMHLFRETPDHLLPYLEGDDTWRFDILELERVTNRCPMVHLAMRTLRRFDVCDYLQCSEETMLRWLQVMQDHYRSGNRYHNATHGADVMQCSAYFLGRQRVKLAFDETDEAASLLGALVHDLDHPGRTNPFLINSQDRLALLYNDISVLESHHVSLAFQLTTKDERINIFKNMSPDDYKTLRKSIIDVVLATEMAKHFEHVGKFSNQILAPLLCMEEDAAAEGGQPISEEEVQELLTRPENRTLIRRVLIKCSDVSNPCRPLNLCKEWANRISEEYFQQTDEEKSRGLPVVMPVFDRSTCNMPKSQVSFIDFFLKEMFAAWHKFCDVPLLLENLDANYVYWKRLIDEKSDSKD